uniref:Reverse transcriptase domain-containing protein n=1 Tax=Tanacetum cinerariifolium TaxID=118510 RepID=A0A6L2MCX6_TANCI|nr:reverse transcriptase domain-containing protein [Tanacetum cinerariifolium]
MNTASSSGLGTLPSNTITNPKEDLKGITTRSGTAYKGPTIPTTSSSPLEGVEREIEVTKDTVPPTNNESTKDIQPPVVQIKNSILNSEPVVAPVIEPVKAPVSAAKPNQKPSVPYPSRLYDQKLRDKANDQKEKFSKSSKICIPTLASRMLSFSCQKIDKSSIDEPPEVELKDLPPHLEYLFLEGDDKLPIIIVNDLSVEEKAALINVLKSHKRAIAWKLSDIKGIVLGHKISKNRIEVDKAKVDLIAKLPHPTTVMGIRSFLGHAGFYQRFIQDFSKITRSMTYLLEKDTSFFFSNECIEAFQTLKRKLTEAPILVAPDWDLPFELMCDASDFSIEKTKRLHDSKIKDRVLNVGDQVLFFNSRLKIFSGKLETRWPGPFTITQVFPYGTVELSQTDGPKFKEGKSRVNEEELEFLTDPGIAEGPVSQTVNTHNAAYQTDDLDAFIFNCDDFSTAKAVLMARLSSYESDVLSKDTNSSAQQDAMILSVFEQLSHQMLSKQIKKNSLFNLIPPNVGTKSVARRIDINNLRSEEAASSSTPLELCYKVLKCDPGHLRRCSEPKKEILAMENLRAIVELEKNKSTALEEKLKEVIVEQYEMRKCMGLMMQEIQRLLKLVPAKSKLVDTPYRTMWVAAYWGFLGRSVGTNTPYLL